MSDSVAIAQSFVTMQAAAARQSLQTSFLRQQADAEKGLVALLEQSAEQAKASLPAGQGQKVDVTA